VPELDLVCHTSIQAPPYDKNPVAIEPRADDHRRMTELDIRPLGEADLAVIPPAFAVLGWPGKDLEQYERYLREQRSGDRSVLVATVAGTFAGYLTVIWGGAYGPFREAGIPEIQDFNVLPQFRRRGIGWSLMDAAEAAIAERSHTAGIGVGLYPDYGQAQRMYARRGYLPDGRGLTCRGVPVEPGATVRIDDDVALMMTRRLR
jgi:ribosomal protein S18 acetylase RimI-like enzyme